MADVIAELIAKFGVKVESEPLEKLKEKSDKAEQSTGRLSKGAKVATGAIAAFGAAAIAAAGQVLQFVEGVVSQNDEIAKTSAKLQVSTDTLQRLRYTAQRSGADVQAVSDAIKDSNKQLFDARAAGGKSPFADALGALGISLDKFESMNPEQRLGAVGDAIGLLESDADKTALAMTIFGESGKELLPMMLSGADGIKAMGDQAERLGGVIGKDALKQSEALGVAMLNVRTTATGLATQVGVKLMPVVEGIVGRFAQWIDENETFIQQDLPNILGRVVEVGASVIGFFVDAIAQVDDFAVEVGHLAKAFDDQFGDAIRTVLDLGEDLVGLWGRVTEAIWKSVFQLLEFVGVLDSAEETMLKIKLGLGMEPEPLATERGGPAYAGGPDTDNNRRLAAERAFQNRIRGMTSAQLAAMAGSAELTASQQAAVHAALPGVLAREGQAAAAGAMASTKARESAAAAKAREAQAKAIAARLAKQRGAAAAAAGGGSAVDTGEASGLFGDEFGRLVQQQGLGELALKAALEAAAKSLASGAKADIARKAGIGALEGLSGATDLGRSGKDVIAEMIKGTDGGGAATGGGGASPVAGAQFVKIDASYNAPTTIEITLPAGALASMNPSEQAEYLREEIGAFLDERNRRAFDHYRANVHL